MYLCLCLYSCIKWSVLSVLFVLTVFNVSGAFFPSRVKLTEASSSWHLNSVEEQVFIVNENSKAISGWNFPTIYLKPSMTSVASWLSLMRPVWWGGEPRSSITVTRRRSSSQSDFWVKHEQTDVETLIVRWPSLVNCRVMRAAASSPVSWCSAVGSLCQICWAQTVWAAASFQRTDSGERRRSSHLT